MLTLSRVKLELTTIVKWVGLFFGIIIGIFLIFKLFFFVKNIVAPSPPAPPSVSFGKLPAPYFAQGIKRDFTYSINTLSGELPIFSDRTNAYKMTPSEPNLLAVKDASDKVASLGFDPNPEILSDSVYRWRGTDSLSKILIMNVNIVQFSLSSNFISEPNILSANNLPTQTDATGLAKDFLTTLNYFPSDIDENKTQTKLLKISSGVILDASSISTTQLITVDFYQKSVNQMPIVYPGGKSSSMNLTVGGGENRAQVVDARFFYQSVSNQSATYPIKTAQQAYSELQKGNAYVASVDPNVLKITINKVYLAYYSPGRSQDFLLPVVVFEGNNDFIAYVSAVTGEWIGN